MEIVQAIVRTARRKGNPKYSGKGLYMGKQARQDYDLDYEN